LSLISTLLIGTGAGSNTDTDTDTVRQLRALKHKWAAAQTHGQAHTSTKNMSSDVFSHSRSPAARVITAPTERPPPWTFLPSPSQALDCKLFPPRPLAPSSSSPPAPLPSSSAATLGCDGVWIEFCFWCKNTTLPSPAFERRNGSTCWLAKGCATPRAWCFAAAAQGGCEIEACALSVCPLCCFKRGE